MLVEKLIGDHLWYRKIIIELLNAVIACLELENDKREHLDLKYIVNQNVVLRNQKFEDFFLHCLSLSKRQELEVQFYVGLEVFSSSTRLPWLLWAMFWTV